MTMIYTADHVDRLVGEIRNWDPKDKDLRRIADVLPLDVLEAAYIRKLDALPERLPWLAHTARDKLQVMRRIFAVWCRTRTITLGELFAQALPESEVPEFWSYANDTLVKAIEAKYPPAK